MADITESLRDFLWDLEGESQVELTFSYNGTDYRTVFNVNNATVGEDMHVIEMENGCIEVSATYREDEEDMMTVHTSKIHEEDRAALGLLMSNGKAACFDPVLTTNGRGTKRPTGKRTTSGDVLQILKTKLLRAFPFMEDEPLTLLDAAKAVLFISPFQLVRGGDAYYEKHGYRSSAITKLKTVLQTFTWSDCTAPIKAMILDCSGKEDYPPGELLTTIMKEITWEAEVACKKPLSTAVFDGISRIVFPAGFDRTFTLDPSSEDWKRCDKELVLTGVSVAGMPATATAVNAATAAAATAKAVKAVPAKVAHGGAGVGSNRRTPRRRNRNRNRKTRRMRKQNLRHRSR
jgi:hypothetical protein